MSSVTTAQLAIYAVLAIPVLFLLYKHGRPGFLGWIYLFAFCSLRVIGGALALKESKAASIVGNIGLSPFLLAACGFIHEAATYAGTRLANKADWVLVMAFHLSVVAATALVASGATALQGDYPEQSDFTKLKAGIAVLTAAWAVLFAWTSFALVSAKKSAAPMWRAAFNIRVGVLSALVFIGIRVIYTLVAFVTQNKSLSPSTGTLAVRVVLSLLPELAAILIFITAGFITKNARSEIKRLSSQNRELENMPKGSQSVV